jgi:hypothetical protein
MLEDVHTMPNVSGKAWTGENLRRAVCRKNGAGITKGKEI